MKSCKYCGRKIDDEHIDKHEAHHRETPVYISRFQNKDEIWECTHCGKICKNLNSLLQHEVRCSKNPNRRNHESLLCYSTGLRGQTKETNASVAKQSRTLKMMYESGKLVPATKGKEGTFRGKHHSAETRWKIGHAVSASRIKGYRDGTITPAHGVGRGKKSFIQTATTTYFCRSTYEFIYALYLLAHNVEFEMEAVRVAAVRPNKYGATFISDFSFGNMVVEVKGIPSEKDLLIKESFESAGYNFIELFHEDIQTCKEWLTVHHYPIDELIEQILANQQSGQLFTYVYAGMAE